MAGAILRSGARLSPWVCPPISGAALAWTLRWARKGFDYRAGKSSSSASRVLSSAGPLFYFGTSPTASLDGENEKLVLAAVPGLSPEIFMVMASHRLENFSQFDQIYSYDPAICSFREARKPARASGPVETLGGRG